MAKQASLTTITSTNNNAATLNTNFNALNTALNNTASLDGSTPNSFSADIDANSNDLLNVKDGNFQRLLIAGVLVNSVGNLANWNGSWTTATAYSAYDIVYVAANNAIYRAVSAHTAGVFATDLAAGLWEVFIGAGLINQAAVAITGGTIDGTPIGGTTPAAGEFTTLEGTDVTVTGDLDVSGADNLATVRTDLGLEIGTDVQASDAYLTDIADLTYAAGDILYVNGSDEIVNLGVGTNGQVLTLASGLPSWAAAAGGGSARTLIGTYDLSTTTLDSGNEVEIDVSAYSAVEGIVVGGACATANSAVVCRVSDDAGVSFDGAGTDYKQNLFNDTFQTRDTNTASLLLTGNGVTAISGQFRIEGLNNSSVETIAVAFGSGSNALFHSIYHRTAKQADDYLQFFNSTGGAYTAGTMIIWGIV